MKWEPVEARHGVNAQADAQRPGIKGAVSYWGGVGLNGVAKWGTSSHKAGDQHRPLQYFRAQPALGFLFMQANAG